MKVLLASFYFPPAGGAGVQRPLKFSGELARAGVEVHVLAPDDPRWLHRDEDLAVPTNVSVHRARYIGPRGRRPAEELYQLRGLRRLFRRLALTPRRLLVPDENVTWAATAIPRALQLIRKENIDVLITTSPPSSVHLIGVAARCLTGVRWVADLRDSVVEKPDRHFERLAVRVKERGNRLIAHLVARTADAVVVVTATIAEEMRRYNSHAAITTIPNGCDFDDFEGLEHRQSERFRITHTGSFFGARTAAPFLDALSRSDPRIIARFVGDFRARDRELSEQPDLSGRVELHGFVSRRRSLEFQRDSEALLLLLPDAGERNKDVPSGKIYEYLAAERPILAAVPHDGRAAEIIAATNSGSIVRPNDSDAIAAALATMFEQWLAGELPTPKLTPEWRAKLSRQTRARELLAVLEALPAHRRTRKRAHTCSDS
jgi:glycosyltransferase involved in cell wall biosynthesis